jgi:methenyltetrahydromethanopterin cyclohydrolase
LQLFKAANYDFYRLDPRLFSPAVLRLHGDSPGQTASFGVVRPDLLQQSWQA